MSKQPNAPLLETMIAYQKKGVGVDMFIKSILGVFRLLMIWCPTSASRAKYARIVDVLIECRMLCNFGRPSMTLHSGMKVFHSKDSMVFWHWLFLCLSYFIRVPEQICGDLNYVQKTVMPSWSRSKLSFGYRFFKSFSLTCCAIVEVVQRPRLARAVAEAKTPADKEAAKAKLRLCDILFFRSLCDMYVYYKWIPSYNPIKSLEFVLSSISGMLGVYLVWGDTACSVAAAQAPSAPADGVDMIKQVASAMFGGDEGASEE